MNELLRRLEQLVDALNDEAFRINGERLALLGARAFPPFGLGLAELETRADSMLALLEVIDLHVGERLPRMEAKLRAGDLVVGQKAVNATADILAAVGGVSPASDVIDDTTRFVDGVSRSAFGASIGLGTIALAVLATAAVLKLSR